LALVTSWEDSNIAYTIVNIIDFLQRLGVGRDQISVPL